MTPTIEAADPHSSYRSKLNSDVRKAKRGAHGLETITVPPNDVFLSLHRVFLGRVKFGGLMLDAFILQCMWMRSAIMDIERPK